MKAAVIGVGHLGKHHARILATLPGVSLAGVVDVNRDRAEKIARRCGTRAFANVNEISDRLDVVVIAVPTESHAAIALPLIESGVHTLVEKPVTQTVQEADTLIAAARRKGVVLAVGHSERFNPAVAAARPHIKDPRFIEVHRLGTAPERLDIDVVLDLMIHDLDLVLSVVASEVERVEAVGVPVLTPRVDIANARVRFKNGCIANLTASRISKEAVRKIRFFQRDAYVSIDTAARDVEVWSVVPQPGGARKIGGGKLSVNDDEPLKAELEDFIGAVRDRRPPAVTGEEGRAALALAVRIVELMAQP